MDWNWNETSIKLPYTSENLKILLGTVCRRENKFSHYDFVKWCDNLTMAFDNDEGEELIESASLAFGIAKDIECQSDLFWSEVYSLEELRKVDQSNLELPHSWFIEWFRTLHE